MDAEARQDLTERSYTLVEMKNATLPFIQDEIVMDEKRRQST
jgi:hypothetical protein